MKIMLPLDEDQRSVCPSFARAPFFLLYDTVTGESRSLDNPAAQADSGAGLQAAQFVVDSGAEVLITVRCGENAAKVFQAAGISIRKALETDAAANLAALAANKLPELTHFHAGFHGISG